MYRHRRSPGFAAEWSDAEQTERRALNKLRKQLEPFKAELLAA